MCGIYGYIGFQEHRLLERMSYVLQHRGPDDVGAFTDDRVSLGIRRLSIIDLPGGRQPIYNEDRSLVVVFNGEIYNYIELRNELQKLGHEFTTQSDTEVIVHSYEEYGIGCLQKFNGMFGFALYDLTKRELILARDRVGIKPLYYYNRNGRLIFGSEIKAILESDCVERSCDPTRIDSFLQLRYVPQPETLFQHIKVLPAAHYIRLKNGDLTLTRYWEVPLYGGEYQSPSYYHDGLHKEFLNAVKLAMRSDVPVGAYLSGGVDSSLIVAAMRQFTNKVQTFSVGFDSPIDETASAREVAQHLDCEHHEVQCLPKDFSLMPKVIWHLERPIGDALILAYYLLAQETSKHVKVVLSGEGADESFAGYQFHKLIKLTELYRRAVPEPIQMHFILPVLNKIPVRLLDKLFIYPAYLGENGKKRVIEYLSMYSKRSLAQNYLYLRSLFDEGEREFLYSERFKRQIASVTAPDSAMNDGKETAPYSLDRLLKLQFDDWLQDNLLLRQDKSTMAHSLEMRVPFLDHNLVEFAFGIPAELKIRWLTDKYIERKLASRMLARDTARRSKIPFYIPVEYFYAHKEVTELIRLALSPAQIKKRGYFNPASVKNLLERMESREFLIVKQVIALVILELWHMVFIDKQRLW